MVRSGSRPADAHDITGTYNVLSAFSPGMQLPTSPEHLIAVLQGMHRGIMHGRPDKSPGAFKLRENRVGARIFVHPDRVQGTLKEGYARYAELTDPFARAVFMMFMVSEVHPFEDGNGRTARAMMNAELWSAGQSPVLIPTVFRGDYLSALRAMSTHGTPAALLAVLDFARTYASELNCSTVPEAELDLAATNAFEVSDQPGVRLVLPSRVAGAP
ncbi:MAG: Fic family protein [Actinobacteria bacterium]|nr:Fic family protein [Actinomycetota bacterium]